MERLSPEQHPGFFQVPDTGAGIGSGGGEGQMPGRFGETSDTCNRRNAQRFNWRKDLSENTRKAYKWLNVDMGDVLPEVAEVEKIDVEVALDELRDFDLIDESDPGFIRLKGPRNYN